MDWTRCLYAICSFIRRWCDLITVSSYGWWWRAVTLTLTVSFMPAAAVSSRTCSGAQAPVCGFPWEKVTRLFQSPCVPRIRVQTWNQSQYRQNGGKKEKINGIDVALTCVWLLVVRIRARLPVARQMISDGHSSLSGTLKAADQMSSAAVSSRGSWARRRRWLTGRHSQLF